MHHCSSINEAAAGVLTLLIQETVDILHSRRAHNGRLRKQTVCVATKLATQLRRRGVFARARHAPTSSYLLSTTGLCD